MDRKWITLLKAERPWTSLSSKPHISQGDSFKYFLLILKKKIHKSSKHACLTSPPMLTFRSHGSHIFPTTSLLRFDTFFFFLQFCILSSFTFKLGDASLPEILIGTPRNTLPFHNLTEQNTVHSNILNKKGKRFLSKGIWRNKNEWLATIPLKVCWLIRL